MPCTGIAIGFGFILNRRRRIRFVALRVKTDITIFTCKNIDFKFIFGILDIKLFAAADRTFCFIHRYLLIMDRDMTFWNGWYEMYNRDARDFQSFWRRYSGLPNLTPESENPIIS
jgi:hypothetical protein